uniref:Uncharacterized protein n=1 Tax=Arundo donax TaxID=35708 RepID=A0A0A9HVB2_ARUDO
MAESCRYLVLPVNLSSSYGCSVIGSFTKIKQIFASFIKAYIPLFFVLGSNAMHEEWT